MGRMHCLTVVAPRLIVGAAPDGEELVPGEATDTRELELQRVKLRPVQVHGDDLLGTLVIGVVFFSPFAAIRRNTHEPRALRRGYTEVPRFLFLRT